jgi:hypothetical protein
MLDSFSTYIWEVKVTAFAGMDVGNLIGFPMRFTVDYGWMVVERS